MLTRFVLTVAALIIYDASAKDCTYSISPTTAVTASSETSGKALSKIVRPRKKATSSKKEIKIIKIMEQAQQLDFSQLVGLDVDVAVSKIKEMDASLSVQAVPEGSMVTKDYRMDRVRVFFDE